MLYSYKSNGRVKEPLADEIKFQVLSNDDMLEQLHFPGDLLKKMEGFLECGIHVAFRCESAGELAKRRNEGPAIRDELGNEYTYTPKSLNFVTKTAGDGLGTGTLLEFHQEVAGIVLSKSDHDYGDFPIGSMPVSPQDYETIRKTLPHLTDAADADVKIRTSNGLICYSRPVTKWVAKSAEQRKGEDASADKYRKSGEIQEHFIQECESFKSIYNHLMSGVYTDFSHEGNLVKFNAKVKGTDRTIPVRFDLSKLIRVEHDPKKVITKITEGTPNKDALTFRNIIAPNGAEINDNLVPLEFSREPGKYQPLMVKCGKYGKVSGDTDLQYIAIPLDIPDIAHKRFDGFDISDHEKMKLGVELLIKRLTLTDKGFSQYCEALENRGYDLNEYNLKNLHKSNSETGNFYLEKGSESLKQLINRLKGESNVSGMSNIADEYIARLSSDLEDPSHPFLSTCGVVSPADILTRLFINDPNVIHGPESGNPKNPSEFTGILHVREGKPPIRTSNEISFLALHFTDPDFYLKSSLVSIHPHWLRDRNEKPNLSEIWLDIIEIQTLVIARSRGYTVNDAAKCMKQMTLGQFPASDQQSIHQGKERLANRLRKLSQFDNINIDTTLKMLIDKNKELLGFPEFPGTKSGQRQRKVY